MDKHAEQFVETFVKELEEANVAIFAGAGLSVGAGYADWKKLLQTIAAELELDIDNLGSRMRHRFTLKTHALRVEQVPRRARTRQQ